MSWLTHRDGSSGKGDYNGIGGESRDNRNSRFNSFISNAPIKRVQVFQLMGIYEENIGEEYIDQVDNVLALVQDGLINVDAARKALGFS